MSRFHWVLELAAVTLALFVWGLVPELLRERDYNLLAAVVFLLFPVAFFELAYCYNGKQKAKGGGQKQPALGLKSVTSQGASRRTVLGSKH